MGWIIVCLLVLICTVLATGLAYQHMRNELEYLRNELKRHGKDLKVMRSDLNTVSSRLAVLLKEKNNVPKGCPDEFVA